MFKTALPLNCLAIAATVATTIAPFQSANAQSIFGEADIDQSNMVAVAVPLNTGAYNLLVIEQFEGKKQCWAESGTAPTLVDPLLLNFDFTGNCRRSTDSNGYSMRIDGEDFGQQYLLRINQTADDLLLVATPSDRSQSEVLIGRSEGLTNGFLKFNLLPGWEFTRRTYQDKPLGHFYFSSDGTQVVTLDSGVDDGGDVVAVTPEVPEIPETPVTPEVPETPDTPDVPDVVIPTDETAASRFTDIGSDIYKTDIEQSVSVGFIAGFQDNTFRPKESLTREQLVSMAIESLKAIPGTSITVANSVSSSPYPDVAAGRWSASKIAWAQQNNIVSGYKDGTFKPTQPVTRAELMAILRRTAEYAQQLQGQSATLAAKNTAFSFVDIDGHWAADLTVQMSQYCNVATPFEESGDRFLPNTASQRNYAAAATLRTLKCVVDPS